MNFSRILEILVTRNGALTDATIGILCPEKRKQLLLPGLENSGSNPAKLKVPPEFTSCPL
ncbi:MAG: hypothetical protein IPI60_10275 [Saprospiraceae bacterium]|nr:hypothetical protein [Saprospiraceae bacterium]